MIPSPGQVYRRIDRPDALVVVLSSQESNRRSRWVTVCMYSLTGLVGDLEDSKPLHSLVPAPGFVTWPIHQSVPITSLTEPLGEVETAALTAARFAMEARFAD
ncbi:hypothetical protein AB0B28_14390 [Glycomyces sp. NPDC046736]|uniref:hypothetical protein n=1 Tax=Glycomyces sp. NPDC046736 TaxID=3155615 RepID=UPI0033F2A31A